MNKDSLGDRMKRYENIERRFLTRRLPLIIRIDGAHFHSFTKGFERPFDQTFMCAMQGTTKCLCESIMGAKLGYTQSDEISLLLTDDDTLETEPWFGKNIQKIVSIAASTATFHFNRLLRESMIKTQGVEMAIANNRVAIFDARAFTLPPDEVMNCFEWREQDAIRNSIQALGQAHFSQKELQNKSCADIKTMLLEQKGINWDDLSPFYQRGTCVIKSKNTGKWMLDEPPIFHEFPYYINDLVYHK